VSARRAWGLTLIAIAAFSCTKLKSNRCDHDSDCVIGHCDPSTLACVSNDAGVGGTGGRGGVGGEAGSAGSKGTGGTPFTCPNSHCKGTTPICDVDAGSCRGCNAEKTTACGSLDAGTSVCVPGDAGSIAGMCVGCLANSDCNATAQAPICNLSTQTCQGCADSNACATKNAAKPVCVTTASGSLAKGTCVGCLTNSDCSAMPTKPICNQSSNSCTPCGADSDCTGMGIGICVKDGHCATGAEAIYVKNDTTSCNDAPSNTTNAGTSTQPFCSMQPVPMYLSLSPPRDLVIVSGTVSGATWSYNDSVTGGLLSIVGQAGAQIASSTSPGFSLQGGSVYIRAVKFSPSASIGIKSTGGSITLDGVTVDSCMGGGIVLSGTTFDIENTTVTANGPGAQGTSGGMNVTTIGAGSKLNLVTIQNNKQIGITCDGKVAATGVYVMSNTGGDIANSCGFSSCSSLATGCGAP
jgi:hypothetical protein